MKRSHELTVKMQLQQAAEHRPCVMILFKLFSNKNSHNGLFSAPSCCLRAVMSLRCATGGPKDGDEMWRQQMSRSIGTSVEYILFMTQF